jgi:mitochondrial fission protein ELM1
MMPTRLSAAAARERNTAFRAELGLGNQRLCAMLIGGNNRTHTFQEEDWKALAEGMNRLAAANGFEWLVTSSRRTGAEAEAILREALDPAHVAHATWWGARPQPIIVPYLSVSGVVFCTEESNTMLSEGIASGKPVYAVLPKKIDYRGAEDGVYVRFVEQNEASRRIRRVHISAVGQIDLVHDVSSYFNVVTADVMEETVERLLDLLRRRPRRYRKSQRT